MDFLKNTTLENDRVQLIPLELKHQEVLLPFSLNESELWQYSLQPGNGEENLKRYLESAVKSREKRNSYPFIVFDKMHQEFAGSTRFYDFSAQHQTNQLSFTWY